MTSQNTLFALYPSSEKVSYKEKMILGQFVTSEKLIKIQFSPGVIEIEKLIENPYFFEII